jgi:hypothetical protein
MIPRGDDVITGGMFCAVPEEAVAGGMYWNFPMERESLELLAAGEGGGLTGKSNTISTVLAEELRVTRPAVS